MFVCMEDGRSEVCIVNPITTKTKEPGDATGDTPWSKNNTHMIQRRVDIKTPGDATGDRPWSKKHTLHMYTKKMVCTVFKRIRYQKDYIKTYCR